MGAPVGARTDLGLAPYKDFDYPRQCGGGRSGRWVPGPETFRVEEVPAYDFCGDGAHAIVVVEKVGRTTRDVAVGVAHRLGTPLSAVGYAGMKDKASVSIQSFSVAEMDEERTRSAFEAEGCRVLVTTRHRNKLRLGHLTGNRFRAFLQGVEVPAAQERLEELAHKGAPNFYGPQRFGAKGDNPARGLAVLGGRLRVSRWKRDLLVSSLQSFLFNEVLARRLERGALDVALEGDVLRREDSGGLFVCADPVVDTARTQAFEVSPTGPMFGRKMMGPSGVVALAEQTVLADLGLADEVFFGATGTRRPLRIPVREWSVEPEGGGVWVSFFAPAGSFATSVVRELTDLG